MTDLRRRVLQALPVLGVGGILVVHWWYSPAAVLDRVDEHGRLLVVVGITGFYLLRPFVLWPLSVASIFLGYVVGFPEGVPVVLAGTLLTCLPPFLLAGYFDDANGYLSSISEAGESFVDTTGEVRATTAARLSPAPADAVSIGAGLAGVSGWTFAVGTLLGELPWAVFYVLLGQSFQTFSAPASRPVESDILLAASICALVLVARPLYRFASDRDR